MHLEIEPLIGQDEKTFNPVKITAEYIGVSKVVLWINRRSFVLFRVDANGWSYEIEKQITTAKNFRFTTEGITYTMSNKELNQILNIVNEIVKPKLKGLDR